MREKGSSALILILLVLISLAFGLFYFVSSDDGSSTPTVEQLPTVENLVQDKQYTSKNLGITFMYPSITDPYYRWPMSVYENGNRIELRYDHPSAGVTVDQWLEVFSKVSDQNFEESINKRFLVGYPPSKCAVINVPVPEGLGRTDYRFAQIVVNSDYYENILDSIDMCVPNYTTTNFASYFIYSPSHPDKFMYLSLGHQQGVALSNGTPWWHTISYVD